MILEVELITGVRSGQWCLCSSACGWGRHQIASQNPRPTRHQYRTIIDFACSFLSVVISQSEDWSVLFRSQKVSVIASGGLCHALSLDRDLIPDWLLLRLLECSVYSVRNVASAKLTLCIGAWPSTQKNTFEFAMLPSVGAVDVSDAKLSKFYKGW
jgi:hypothetical protein